MMNYPGVLFKDKMVMEKIATAHRYGKPIDGHAPGLRGADAKKYIAAGISTDHECFTKEEALDKLACGMKILIREGSAAKNFSALVDLIPEHTDRMMFCSDDKHPDDLLEGHINQLVSRAIAKGHDLYDVLKIACINAVEHYGLSVGMMNVGDPADFIVVEDLKTFEVKQTYINGNLVANNGKCTFSADKAKVINNFNTSLKSETDFKITSDKSEMQVIKAIDGEIVTETFWAKVKNENGLIVSDTEQDILKMTVVNRYENQAPAIAFINNFNLKNGAIASCVGHDSHNIIAVGVDDESIARAVNLIIENKGGISAVSNEAEHVLALPVAGIMTNADGPTVAAQYLEIDNMVKKQLGTQLAAPFMTLSFMALLVIPQLKLSNLGLFDGKNFEFTPLFR
jgi:adenine deaminase